MKSIFLCALVALGISGPASAITFTNPLSLDTQFLAGIMEGQLGNSNPETEAFIAQTILDLSLGEDDDPFFANNTFDYSGTVTFTGPQIDSLTIPAGWGGGLAKYDGPQGGYVLFLFGGTASTIPQYPYNLFTTNQTQYALSHVTLFRGTGGLTPTPTTTVPDGGSMLMLLGGALVGLEGLRRAVLRASSLATASA